MTATQTPQRERLLTIGAVCERLKSEFPDISISKIRYLEGRGASSPRSARAAVTGCSARTSSSASRRSCGCSVTSSCR